jgi:Flp pilus assembly protein TadG
VQQLRKGIFGKQRGLGSWGQRGQALVEFALVSVLFFILSFGVFDMARLFQSWVSVQHASREAARYAITGLTTCDGAADRDACITWTAEHATGGLARAGAGGQDVDVTTKAWDYDPDTASWVNPPNDGDTGLPCDQIEVTVAYNHKFVLPVLSAIAPSGVTVVGRQRMTIEPYAPCEDKDGTGSGVSASPTSTPTPPSGTPAPTNTPAPTSTPAPTNTPVPTATPIPPTPTNTPAPTATPDNSCPWWRWWC